jgi:GNAT superfamily N-acetyltransferase
MELQITSLAERPDLAGVFDDFPDSWPEFMYHDNVSEMLFNRLVRAHPESNIIAVDAVNAHRPVARACAFPFSADLGALPPSGYDQVLLSGAADLLDGRARGPLAAAIEVTIRPDARGTGLSGRMLAALRATLTRLGYEGLVVPVRPNRKHEHPSEPMTDYVGRIRADGLPEDPWLRTHIRAGATIAGIATTSMTVTAPLDDWRKWTGLPFDRPGETIVPLALVPVVCDPAQGVATYVEPNVWVHHSLRPGTSQSRS